MGTSSTVQLPASVTAAGRTARAEPPPAPPQPAMPSPRTAHPVRAAHPILPASSERGNGRTGGAERQPGDSGWTAAVLSAGHIRARRAYRTDVARVLVGTSGYLYRHWRNVLYPEGLGTARWLPRY